MIGVSLLTSLTACQSKKTPTETTQLFWSAIAQNKIEIAKEQCSSQSQQLPSPGISTLKNVNFNYGKIIIDGSQASVETKIISQRDNKSSFTTYLVNEDDRWKIDCQRSSTEFNGNQVFKDFFNNLNTLGESINNQLEQQIPLIEKEIEAFGQELKQQLDNFENELKEALPKKQKSINPTNADII